MSDYLGSFLVLGRAVEKLAEAAEKLPPPAEGEAADRPKWPDPSVSQLRQAVTEYCIWPLGEQLVKDHWSGVRAALLVGCPGAGKRMLANAIATESGANFFDLSPAATNGLYPGKKGPYEMCYAVLKLAKAYQPSVIWIGDCEVRGRATPNAAAPLGRPPACQPAPLTCHRCAPP
jgi:SpoVK/Ycf46/Vps4 family AAA+-type ATPase